MKWLEIFLLVLVILATCFLTSCSQGGSAYGKMNCSPGGEVCITISTVQSFSVSGPVALKITVTSSKDISDLLVSLNTSTEVTVDGPQYWENYLSYTLIERGMAVWKFAIKADQLLTFNRVLHFPAKEGWFSINAEVVNFGRTLVGIDSFGVLITRDGGYVLREGTPPPPYTPNATAAAYGPGTPVPTFLSASKTPIRPLVTSPTPTPSVRFTASSTVLPPYPPPPTLTPTPTTHPYP